MNQQQTRTIEQVHSSVYNYLQGVRDLDPSMTLTSLQVLVYLIHHMDRAEPISLTEIKKALSISSSLLSRSLAYWQRMPEPFVTVTISDSDKRLRNISLTAEGREYAAILAENFR